MSGLEDGGGHCITRKRGRRRPGIGGSVMSLGAVILVFGIFSLFSPALSSASGAARGVREFDYFLLSLQWPGTLCRSSRHCCPSNGCCKRSVALDDFTIHGLWPDYNDGTWPACCSNNRFDVKKVSPLIGKLSKYWPTLSCSSSSNCHGGRGLFWAHEWEKHGTCSSPVIQDEYSYFSTTLDLYFKYNITKVLKGAGFLASNAEKYKLAEISAVIKNSTGASPSLVCSHDTVQELRLCLHKDFTPRDCGILSSTAQDDLDPCPQYIRLPKFTPPPTSADLDHRRGRLQAFTAGRSSLVEINHLEKAAT